MSKATLITLKCTKIIVDHLQNKKKQAELTR